MKAAADWPRYMVQRRLRSGATAFYWVPSQRDRTAGLTLGSEALGGHFEAAAARARLLNEHLDAWRDGHGVPPELRQDARVGTVDWWHAEYLHSTAYLKLSARSRRDYREVLASIADLPTTMIDAQGAAISTGALPVSSLSPAAVDKIYARLRDGGRVNRQADYAIDVARRAWKIVRRAHPGLFLVPVTGEDGKPRRIAINPWEQMVRADYERDTATPATRDEALALAGALTAVGHPAIGVAALVCYEWLQRPQDVIGGRITWTDYRPAHRPGEVLVIHHKTGQQVWQPLDEIIDADAGDAAGGAVRRLYPEIEAAIARLDRLGVPMVMMRPERGPKGHDGTRTPRLYSQSHVHHLVQRARADAGLGRHVTLEACRHGGMTELGDCELTEQEIMSLSGHVTPAAARVYVKRTQRQRLQAAIKRRDAVEAAAGGTKRGGQLK